jgi:enoyl-CoA hydratase
MNDLQYTNLDIAEDDGILFVTINRPEVRNSLNKETWAEFKCLISDVRDKEKIKVIIVTGAGDKTFAAGADIKQLNKRSSLDVLNYGGQEVLSELENLPKPTIAAINGAALGGGCELAMACDIRIASEIAKIGLPETGLGIIPGFGGTQRMVKLVGIAKAKELIFTGEIISAVMAEKIGLVNKVVPSQELMKEAIAFAKKIMTKAPLAIRMSKNALNLCETNSAIGLAYEKMAQTFLFTTEDRMEGTSAFIEKRAAQFTGK